MHIRSNSTRFDFRKGNPRPWEGLFCSGRVDPICFVMFLKNNKKFISGTEMHGGIEKVVYIDMPKELPRRGRRRRRRRRSFHNLNC
jgi:hypothetical protein